MVVNPRLSSLSWTLGIASQRRSRRTACRRSFAKCRWVEDTVPRLHVHSLETALREGRRLRQGGQSGVTGHGERFQLAALDVSNDVDRNRKEHLHVSAKEIDRGCAPFVRDVPNLYARQHVEHFPGHMGCPSGAGRCEGELIRIRFGKRDQLLHGVGGHTGMQHEYAAGFRGSQPARNRRPDRPASSSHWTEWNARWW